MQRWILQSGAEDEQAEEQQQQQQQQQDDEALSWPDSVPLSTSPGSSSGGSSSGSDSGRPEVGAFFRDLARRRASLRAGRCLAGRGAVMRQAVSACVWRGGQV